MLSAALLMTALSTALALERTAPRAPSRVELGAKSNHNNAHVDVWCDSAPLDLPPKVSFAWPRWHNVTHVTLHGCYPPTGSLGALFPALRTLEMVEVPPGATFNASHFAGLDLVTKLKVRGLSTGEPKQQLAADFLRSLPALLDLTVQSGLLSPLAESRLAKVSLLEGRSLGAWGGCSSLFNVRLRDWRVPFEDKWLAHCEKVHTLHLQRMRPNALPALLRGLAAPSPGLILELQNNTLTTPQLRVALSNVTRLFRLNVSHNNITDIDFVLDSKWILQSLDLSHNMLSNLSRTLRAVGVMTNRLHNLFLDHNPMRGHCAVSHWLTAGADFRVSLASTGVKRLCFSHWWRLLNLNLSDNNVEKLQFGKLPIYHKNGPLTVDLSRNPLRKVYFDQSHYQALNCTQSLAAMKMTVYTDPLPPFDCDCRNAWLARALREDCVRLPGGARCLGSPGGALRDAPPRDLECDLKPCKPCRCRQQWATRTLRVYCEGRALRAVPAMPHVTELHLRSNQIYTILIMDLPETLTVLDVRDNNVSRLGAAVAAALFEEPARRVLLSGNPLACDCDSWPLLDALKTHYRQVEDYEDVTCVDGRALRDLSEELLCGARGSAWPALAAGGAALAAGGAALSGALYTRCSRPLKMWLYARGWCLPCVREREPDSQREYDVFVSFAHGDHELVAGELLPELERSYTVCVHYRDWTPGELIATQIARSVDGSRRTLVVLSAGFIRSQWGLAEFRAAHASSLSERRVRVLVVALEDAPAAEELPEELRLYLRSTTYLRWDDPWFWDKLRYALPHRAVTKERARGHAAQR